MNRISLPGHFFTCRIKAGDFTVKVDRISLCEPINIVSVIYPTLCDLGHVRVFPSETLHFSWQCTIVYVGMVVIGSTMIEMAEEVDVPYVDGKYIRERDYVPSKRSR